MKLSVVLPCYNEKDNLPALFKRLDGLAADKHVDEIILVDNGSFDGSHLVFEQEMKSEHREKFKIIRIEKNIGYGNGILTGLRSAKGCVLAYTHADIQTDPMDVLRAYEIYKKTDDEKLLVKGERTNRKLSEAIFSFGMGVLASLALGCRLSEINAQPKLFSRSFFESVEQYAPSDFSLDLYLLYQAKQKGKIKGFPVLFSKRMAGEAKGGSGSSWKVKWKLIRRSFVYIFELRSTLKK